MGVSAFQDTSTVHACSTVMALLCIPVSKLVSFAFSTIPICPFLIQRIFHLLVYIYILFSGLNPPPTHSHTQVLLHKQVGSIINNLSIHDLQGAVIIHLPFNHITSSNEAVALCVSECSGL